jgi:hypothetical protein
MDIDLIEKKIRELQILLGPGGLAAHAALTGSSAHGAVSAPTASQIITRDAAGRAQIVAPSVAADIVNKGTLDTHAALTGSSAHGAVSAPTANQIITRDAAGRAQVVAPSAAADIARKDTVDAVQTNLTTHAALTNPHSATAAPTADRLVLRDAAGRAQIVAPSVAADIVNKGTLDTHAALTGSSAHGAVSAPTASQLMTRDAAGRAQVVAPSVAADIARKDTVDAVQTNLTNHAALTNPHSATAAATADRLVLRDGAGRAQVVAPSVAADIATKGYADGLLANPYPVGSYYTQYPDASSNDDATEFPTSQRPATLFGGTWAEQWPTESVYFRTRGTLSDTNRTNGKQEDQYQGHWHQIFGLGGSGTTVYGYSGTISKERSTKDPAVFPNAIAADPVTDGTYGTPRTGAETRAVNRRIKVWKRTA